jgi:hypothetical protein
LPTRVVETINMHPVNESWQVTGVGKWAGLIFKGAAQERVLLQVSVVGRRPLPSRRVCLFLIIATGRSLETRTLANAT